MALAAGTRLGPYEIAAQIGEGGMGEVYQATDTNLARQVAIKVLPASVASDPERLARFDREAKTLAALNHPNIAQIHGLEKGAGTIALVMELVEGPTLADRIAQGAIPVDEALPIAKQIAEALEAAHEQGIIHRDLKPANVKVRPDGTVKVLDFGLAKAMEPAGSSPDVSQAPTITTPAMTQQGVILGTAAYMSPEQARGKSVDKRADIWAFGVVLFEMLTGKRAFGGSEMSDVLASVLAREPDWALLPRGLSPTLASFIKQCLHKDPKQRVPDIAAMRLVLEGAFEMAGPQVPATAAASQPAWRRGVPLALGATLGALVVGFVGWSLWPSAEPPSVSRFNHVLPEDQQFRNTVRDVMAVSPDGRHFVYNTTGGLYLRTMGELEARLIPGTEVDLGNPFFSPDGESVGYWQAGEFKRLAISGGAPVVICAANPPFGASWASNNTILFGQIEGIMRVPADGGTPELVIPAAEGEWMDGPQLLPDGESVLFSVTTATGNTRWDQARIVVQSLRTGERTVVWQGGSDARYLPTGHLVYALGEALFALAFDADRLEVSGGPVSLVDGVPRLNNPATNSASASYGVSNQGTLVHIAGGNLVFTGGPTTEALRTLVWVDRQGLEEPLAAPSRPYSYPRLSPDGTQVAVDSRDTESEIWIWNIARETMTRLTFDPGLDRFPLWSPDGQRIAFSSQRDGSAGNPFWQAADGTGQAERLIDQSDSGSQVFPTSFSPDGTRLLVYGDPNSSQEDDIGIVSLETEDGLLPLLRTEFDERNPDVSPDGRWLAYESAESGQLEIYVRPFPDVDAGRWQVSISGGTQPLWARDGRELFYRAGAAMMAVPVQPGPAFVFESPAVVFEEPYLVGFGGRAYDITPDGQRFLMLKEGADGTAAEAPPDRLIVVQNWFEELRRLVPTN
jgi:serine/threonine protein kinase/Tol biopolymer transport system component